MVSSYGNLCGLEILHKTSASSSDFKLELPQSVSIPRRALGWIADLHLPVTWYGVEVHCNVAYFGIYAKYPGTVPTYKVPTVALMSQNYTGETLAAELNSKLNAAPRFTNVIYIILIILLYTLFLFKIVYNLY